MHKISRLTLAASVSATLQVACSPATIELPPGDASGGDPVGGDAAGGDAAGGDANGLPGTLVAEFFSDFATAIGTSEAAVSDNGKWDTLSADFEDAGEVVPSTGLGFPATMSNVLMVKTIEQRAGWLLVRRSGMSVPEVASARAYRWYWRPTYADNGAEGNTHPIQDGFAGSNCNWSFNILHNTTAGDGFWGPMIYSNTDNPWPNDRWSAAPLAKQATYRCELRIARVTTDTFTMQFRIYDASGALVRSEADFTNQDGSATLADNPTFQFHDVANLDGLNGGCNGSDGPYPSVYGYQGGFAVVDDQGWIGPYGSVVGEPY